ncbi:hypothetical protein [Nocardia terpenica]|uniref:Uncharacterized protein n=1 Tax=Nocardia terpenica TaxID=455432 RepID=A0A291RJF3_9NOCA|nr:hypothetical protein [Nocardia terpenica]ATL67284.1 hypothetical protein CRH09_14855 [Nocardia terpenica]
MASLVLQIAAMGALPVVLWLVLTAGKVPRRSCAICGHSNYIHDSATGECHSRVGLGSRSEGEWPYCDHDLRCPCPEFAEDPVDLTGEPRVPRRPTIGSR